MEHARFLEEPYLRKLIMSKNKIKNLKNGLLVSGDVHSKQKEDRVALGLEMQPQMRLQ